MMPSYKLDKKLAVMEGTGATRAPSMDIYDMCQIIHSIFDASEKNPKQKLGSILFLN